MKQFGTMMGLVALAAADGCLYCRRMDLNSGALVSWSYCKQTDQCVKNVWNYVTRTCQAGWVGGKDLDFEQCETTPVDCPSFTSTEEE